MTLPPPRPAELAAPAARVARAAPARRGSATGRLLVPCPAHIRRRLQPHSRLLHSGQICKLSLVLKILYFIVK